MRYEVFGIPGIPEVRDDDDIAALIVTALSGGRDGLRDGDIVVVTSKIVSKAEGRVLAGTDRESAIDAETVRTVAEWNTPRGRTRVVETRHGLVLAAAGVDASNVAAGHVVLLPIDPDESARAIRAGLAEIAGVNVGVIVTDTVGRVWRQGVTDIAIGAAGIHVIDDLRGKTDEHGNELGVTMVAVADEIAAASEPVRSKLAGVPVSVVRGLNRVVRPAGDDPDAGDEGAATLIRPSLEDRFRLGTPEAMRAAMLTRRDVTEFTAQQVDPAIVRRAIAAALTGPVLNAHHDLRFVLIDSDDARKAVAESLYNADTAAAATIAEAPGFMVVYLAAGSQLAGAAAVQNLLVALAAEGIGSAWLDVTVSAPSLPELDVPAHWSPAALIAYGHPRTPLNPRIPPDPTPKITSA